MSGTTGFMLLFVVVISGSSCQQVTRMAGSCRRCRFRPHICSDQSPVLKRVVDDAIEQTTYTHALRSTYEKLAYPGGDVPRERGACSDVIIRLS